MPVMVHLGRAKKHDLVTMRPCVIRATRLLVVMRRRDEGSFDARVNPLHIRAPSELLPDKSLDEVERARDGFSVVSDV